MKIRCTNLWVVLGVVLLLSACEKEQIVREGMKPIYYSYEDFSELRSEPPLPYGELGKIITSGNYIFINEIGYIDRGKIVVNSAC